MGECSEEEGGGVVHDSGEAPVGLARHVVLQGIGLVFRFFKCFTVQFAADKLVQTVGAVVFLGNRVEGVLRQPSDSHDHRAELLNDGLLKDKAFGRVNERANGVDNGRDNGVDNGADDSHFQCFNLII